LPGYIQGYKNPIVILCGTTSGLFVTTNDMANEQFYEKNIKGIRVSFIVRFRVRVSVRLVTGQLADMPTRGLE